MQKVLNFATHPIQYQVPLYRELAKKVDLTVVYLHRQTGDDQAVAGFNVKFEWDVPLYDGYEHTYLENQSKHPSTQNFQGVILKQGDIEELFKKYSPDKVILHGWFPRGVRQILNYCYKHKIFVLARGDSNLTMTSSKIKQLAKEVFMRLTLKKFSKFLAVGEANKEFYLHYGVPGNKIGRAVHCIDTPFFQEYFRKYPRQESKKIRLGFAGKLIDKKSPLLLLKAVAASNFSDEIEVVVVGDGPLKSKMLSYADENDISIDFRGFLNQTEIVKEGYRHMDVLVLPSKNETWGLVVNEAMTGGIPAILSDTVGCAADLIDEGLTGYTFKSMNLKDLTEKINNFVVAFKSGQNFSEEVLKRIEQYSLNATLKGYLEALEVDEK